MRGAAEVISLGEVRARKQWQTLRHHFHDRFDQWLDRLESELPEVEPTLGQVSETIWALRQLSTCLPSTAEAQRLARPTAVHWGMLSWGNHWLKDAGLQIPPFEIPQEVLDIYPDLGHAHNWEEAIAATAFVPDDVVAQLCDALGLIGTPEHCAQRIRDMTKVGVTNLYLMPLQTFVGPEQEIRAFRDVVLPRLRAEGYL